MSPVTVTQVGGGEGRGFFGRRGRGEVRPKNNQGRRWGYGHVLLGTNREDRVYRPIIKNERCRVDASPFPRKEKRKENSPPDWRLFNSMSGMDETRDAVWGQLLVRGKMERETLLRRLLSHSCQNLFPHPIHVPGPTPTLRLLCAPSLPCFLSPSILPPKPSVVEVQPASDAAGKLLDYWIGKQAWLASRPV
jgi:hypothetical protein